MSSDTVAVTYVANPTVAVAGPDQPGVCGLVATLAGNTPSVGNGVWSQVSGPATASFSGVSSPTATATVTLAGSYTFRWTISNGSCTSSDDVVVVYTSAVGVTASVQNAICFGGTGSILASAT